MDRCYNTFSRTITVGRVPSSHSRIFQPVLGDRNAEPYHGKRKYRRQNRSLLERLRNSHALNQNWKSDLEYYFIMYHTTSRSTMGKTPTKLCFGRTIRGRIPSLVDKKQRFRTLIVETETPKRRSNGQEMSGEAVKHRMGTSSPESFEPCDDFKRGS